MTALTNAPIDPTSTLRGTAGELHAQVTCTVKWKSRSKVKVTCKVKLNAASARVRWNLTRKGRIVVGGVGRARNGHFKLHLPKIEKLHKGRYVLHVAGRKGGTAFVVR